MATTQLLAGTLDTECLEASVLKANSLALKANSVHKVNNSVPGEVSKQGPSASAHMEASHMEAEVIMELTDTHLFMQSTDLLHDIKHLDASDLVVNLLHMQQALQEPVVFMEPMQPMEAS